MHTTLFRLSIPISESAKKLSKINKISIIPSPVHEAGLRPGGDDMYYRTLFESALDCILVIDPMGRLVDLNHQSCLTLGYRRDELLGESFSRVLDAALMARLFPRTDMPAEERRTIRGEHDLRAKDGTFRSVEYVASPLPDGSVLAVVRDVTERKRSAEALRSLNNELEKRVAEKTAELRQAYRELESFSFSVSHDLRTPLRGIGAIAEMLRKKHGAKFNCDAILDLESIEQSAARMGRLIDDLLRMSMAGRGEIARVAVDMRTLVNGTVKDHLTPAYSCAIIDIRNLPPVCGDRGLLGLVWGNLIGNALKYSSRVPHPRITIGGEIRGEFTEYWVSDNGAGFDMARASKLFEPFVRLHASSEFEGTGIGLATVQRIVHRHGGRLRAEGKIGEGATFYFSLPTQVHLSYLA